MITYLQSTIDSLYVFGEPSCLQDLFCTQPFVWLNL